MKMARFLSNYGACGIFRDTLMCIKCIINKILILILFKIFKLYNVKQRTIRVLFFSFLKLNTVNYKLEFVIVAY